MCRYGCAQEERGSLCAPHGARWPTASADALVGHDDGAVATDGRMADGAAGDARSHGIHRCVLETDLQHSGRAVRGVVGERATPQTSARTKTDWSDCQWIAQLLQHGLLRG